ncbi:MAG TPA: exodeoxyribonuclease VII small subunit [Ignavibacteria bacterium]|nr:exodeoxyribonuclease VII small subunit [Bacteroidota bacterium]HRI83977.1 exodeoxyribonuclease VII small subunit [Ignavibacteria bacterium]HRJ99174.1 exodeoxyribonuclease VII small subunit [Ignavibacteria bacterium]
MSKKKVTEDTFGSSYKKLEVILAKLETEIEDHSLEEIIEKYQEAINLLKICRKKLDEAELKIEKLSTEEEN